MTRPSVLLTTEGTYPHHRGGVSTWCHALTHDLVDVDFTLLAVAMHPYVASQYQIASNVRDVITVPLWGTIDPAEFGRHSAFPSYLKRRWSTTRPQIEKSFLPAYAAFLREMVAPSPAPLTIGPLLLRLHEHFSEYDYHRTQTDLSVWGEFVSVVRRGWQACYPDDPSPSLDELGSAWRLLYRLMLPLAVDVPRVDLTHSAAAAFCGLPCIVSKLRWQTPYLLTEHGVYLREQYLNLGRNEQSFFVRWFLFRLMSAIVDVNYAYADQVSPVCDYNTRWERWRNVEPERIKVIYNGVDPARFSSAGRPPNTRPTVVSVGLIFPLKGQADLIEAAALVRHAVPDVEFRIYGSASDDEYFEECQARVRAHGLEHHVTFAGSTNTPWKVLANADVVVLPSISEAFPYALVEAMLSEAAIVATDVGGVREALGTAGVLVYPHEPAQLSEAIAGLLRSPETRARLGVEARERALRLFTRERFVEGYRASYERLMARTAPLANAEWAALLPRASNPVGLEGDATAAGCRR